MSDESPAPSNVKPSKLVTGGIIDTDIHPVPADRAQIRQFLATEWHDHFDTYGYRLRLPTYGSAYPKAAPALSRRDAWPPNGGPPGSDLGFMQFQHLDHYDVRAGIMHVLAPTGRDQLHPQFGLALNAAINDWLDALWVKPEPRLKGSVNIAYDDVEASVREIERCAKLGGFVSVSLPSKTFEPIGKRRFWPIYEAALQHGMAISVHTGGANGITGTAGGWPSYYAEDHHAQALSMQALLASLIFQGVFEEFPALRVVLVEAGFTWVPSFGWRMDKHFARMRDEVRHLRMLPTEYMRRNVWYATQPIDESQRGRDILEVIDWIGWEKVLFSSDYPHWDMDDPRFMFKAPLSQDQRDRIFRTNAETAYAL